MGTHQPVYGFAGGPVCDYAGAGPVAMESPCPYDQWDTANQVFSEASMAASGSGDSASIAVTASSSLNFTGRTDFLMICGTPRILSATLSKSGSLTEWLVRVTLWVGDVQVADQNWTNTVSGALTFSVPYYRYRVRVYAQSTAGVSAGDSLTVNLDLS